jgi:hypothetical protein
MLTTTEDSRQLDRLGNAIRAYHLASGRTLAFAMLKTGRELAFALHKETARIAPSESELLELPGKLGWRIKRGSGGGRGSAMAEIFRRIKARKFAAAGWLPAIRGFVRPDTVTTLDKRLGAVLARVETTGATHITLINRAGPIEKVTAKHGILRKAVNDVFRGFAPYIRRKLGEEARRAFWKL